MFKYIEVKNEIKKLLDNYEVDDILPTHDQLSRKYNVSDITIRKAFHELIKEGYIYGVRRKGSFKAQPPKEFKEVSLITNSLSPFNIPETSLFPGIIIYLEKWLKKTDTEIVLSFYDEDPILEKRILNKLIVKKPFGVICNPSGYKENLELYKNVLHHVDNFVFIDRYYPNLNAHYVGTDSFNGAYEMIEPYKDEDFDKIFVIFSNKDKFLHSDIERLNGFNKALKDFKCQNIQYIFGNEYFDNYLNGTKEILDKELDNLQSKKIGIFSSNCECISFCYKNIKEKFNRLKSCFIASFDKPVCDFSPNITVKWYWQNIDEISKKAVEIISNNPKEKQKIYIKGIIY